MPKLVNALACAAALLALPTTARLARADAGTAGVIGGTDVPVGRWPDAAAVFEGGEAVCTGTLIAPTVVITAGHCNSAQLTAVLVGTNSLATPSLGESIPIASRHEYPSSQSSFDVTVLVLARASTVPPRPIATGWARVDLVDGALVQIAGYGSIDQDGNDYIDHMREATIALTDADCSSSSGCVPAAQPAGELGAGGGGIDTCPGDSGGPLYLLTPYGDFLAGVTSRGYDNSTHECGEGGIYVRPDKIVDWIESEVGPVSRGPEPAFAPLVAVNGDAAQTTITANDPQTDAHGFAIETMPAHATAVIDPDDGRVRVCTDAAFQGEDAIGVTITDARNPTRVLHLTMPITVQVGTAPDGCSLAFEDTGDEGGCCHAGPGAPGGTALLAGLLAVVLGRRRRRGGGTGSWVATNRTGGGTTGGGTGSWVANNRN